MESTNDQAEMQSDQDQPENGNGDQAIQQSQTFEVNWQKLSWEQLVSNYKNLQAEFTRKTQELSKTKKESELSDDDKNAIEFLRKNNFLTREDLEWYASQRQKETRLSEIISLNPELQSYEIAIKDLSKSTWLAPEDVIEKYGFKSKDKLAKAKSQGDIKWTPSTNKTKTIAEMSMDEYEKWRKEKWIWNKWTFSR